MIGFRALVSRPPVPFGTAGWAKQTVYVYLYESAGVEAPHPTGFPILVGKDEKGYAAGEYILDPSTFQAKGDKYGNLELAAGRFVLTPIKGK